MKDTYKCLPIFNSSSIDYISDEENGAKVFTSKRHPELRRLKINKQSIDILNLSNGDNTLDDIASLISKKYKDANVEDVRKDVMKMLLEFWKLGLIMWNGENPFLDRYIKKIDKGVCEILTEEKSIQILRNNDDFYNNPLLSRNYCFDAINIGQRVYFGFEQIATLTSEKLDVLYGLAYKNIMSRAAYINFYSIFSEEIDINVKELLNWSIKKYAALLKIKLERLDTLIVKESLSESDYKNRVSFASNIGFVKTGILKKHVLVNGKYNDVEVYSLFM